MLVKGGHRWERQCKMVMAGFLKRAGASDTDMPHKSIASWWRHQIETFSALLVICAGNSPVPVNSPQKGQWRTRSFHVFFNLRLNKRLSKQAWGWWFETISCPLWRHCNVDSSRDRSDPIRISCLHVSCWLISSLQPQNTRWSYGCILYRSPESRLLMIS